MYNEKKADITIDLEKLQENGNELGQLIQKNNQELEEIAIADILEFAQDYLSDEDICGVVYTLSLSDTTALSDFDDQFFANAAVSIEGKSIQYGSGKITLVESFDAAKITFSMEHATLELTLTNYTAPEKPVVPETEDGFAYRFFTETASVAEILAANEIESSYYSIVSLSDGNLITVDEDTLTVQNYFGEVVLTVALSDGTEVEIKLSNPAPVEVGETVTGENGSFSASEAVPAGTKLAVEAVQLTEEEKTAVEAKVAETLGSDAQPPVYFDISLVGPQGEKLETGATVTVKTAIELPEAPEGTVAKVTGVKVFHVTDSGVEPLDADWTIGESGISSVSFTTPGFSLFGISYTVDFVFAGVQFSMPGGESIKLSELFENLHIEDEILGNETITFSDDTLLAVENIGEDWRLYSLRPFSTTEQLSVLMANGNLYEFVVTDDQGVSYDLRDAVSVVTLDGQTVPSGTTLSVRPEDTYKLHIEFSESTGSVQFDSSGTITYTINGFAPSQALTGVPMRLDYTEDGVTHSLVGCTFDVGTDGTVTFHLTPEAAQKIATSGDAVIKLDIDGKFDPNTTHIDFGSTHEWNVNVDSTPSVDVQKTGSYHSDDNMVHYRIEVSSVGTNNPVTVTDTITGTALTLNSNSIVVKDVDGNIVDPSSYTQTVDGNKFVLGLGEMTRNQKLYVEYTASVNWDGITGKGTVAETENKVKVNENPEKTTDLANSISYNPLSKSVGSIENGEDDDTKYIPWTVTVNAQHMKNMKGTTITDTIDSSSIGYLSYADHNGISGIKLERFLQGSDTAVSTEYISWADLGVTDPDQVKTWSYKIPEDETENYEYRFTYYTKVDLSQQNGKVYPKNNTSDDNWNSSGSYTEVNPGSGYIGVRKQVDPESITKDKMSWTVKMDVPKGGLNKAVLTDTLPHMDWGGYKFQDTLKDGTLHITGLYENENYQIKYAKDKFIITFYQDRECTMPGLLPSTNDQRREILVTFDTENDPDWVRNARNSDHTNNVEFVGGNSSVTDSDTGRIPVSGINKSGEQLSELVTLPSSSDQVFAYRYTIDLYGINEQTADPIVLTDTFNNTYLRFYDLSTESVLTGMDGYNDQYILESNNFNNKSVSRIVPAINGSTLTFTINKNDLPKDGGGNYLPQYKIIYYLVVKDAATMTQMFNDSLLTEDKRVHLTNTITGLDSEDSVTIDYGYDALQKENIAPIGSDVENSTYDPATGMTGFRITINPLQKDLNSTGDTLTLTDEFTGNLSIDYSSIKIYIDDSAIPATSEQVQYNYRGTVGTFTIPDNHKVVIVYNAKVIGTPGSWVHYGNTARMDGYIDSTNGSTQMNAASEASMNINSIKIYKYAAGNMLVPIPNIQFTLVDENGNPMVYMKESTSAGHVHRIGDEIVYTTGEDGYAEIKPDEEADGFSLQKGITYYLKETFTTPNYATNNIIYRFTLSDQPNYDNYEYHSGDIMKIYNWPVTGRLEIKKSLIGAENLTEEEKRMITFTVTGVYPGTNNPVLVDDQGYTVTAEKAAAEGYTKQFSLTLSLADFKKATGEENYTYVMEDLVPGDYSVTETGWLLNGYQYTGTTTTIHKINTDGTDGEEIASGISDKAATVSVDTENPRRVEYTNRYNKQPGAEIIIKKINAESGTTLNLYGAKFKLEKLKDGTTDEYETVTSGSVDANGLFTIPYANKDTGVKLAALTEGTYRITEVEAPANYTIVGDGSFIFTVNKDGDNYTVSNGTNDVNIVTYTQSGTDHTFTVNNKVKHSYTITKVDGANVSVKLAGAVFTVYEHVYGTDPADDIAAINAGTLLPIRTYTTNSNGQFEILVNDLKEDGTPAYSSDNVDETKKSRTYFILETTAPEGYSLPSNQTGKYFYFGERPGDQARTKAANLKDNRYSQTITNDLIDLTVQKLWKDLDGNDKKPTDVDEIEFVLYQMEIKTALNADGTLGDEISRKERQYPNDSTIYTIERNSANDWNAMTIGSVPVAGQRTKDWVITYTYRVEETVPDGYQVAYSSDNSGRTLKMTNKPLGTSVEVVKVWTGDISDELKAKGTELWLYRKLKNGTGDWTVYSSKGEVDLPILTRADGTAIDINSREAWTARWDDLPTEYLYKVVEVLTNGPGGMTSAEAQRFDIDYSANNGNGVSGLEDGQIIVTNHYRSTSVKARKVWIGVPEGYNMNDLYFKLDLMRKPKNPPEGTTATWEVVSGAITDNNVYEAEWTDLDSDYYYMVVEQITNGHMNEFEVQAVDENGNALPFVISGTTTARTIPTDASNGIEGGEVTYTNIYKGKSTDKFAVQKAWIDRNGDAMTEKPDMTVTGEVWRKVMAVDQSAGHKITINLRKDGSGTGTVASTYIYYVASGGGITFGSATNGKSVIASYNGITQQIAADAWNAQFHITNITANTEINVYIDGGDANQAPAIDRDNMPVVVTGELPYSQQVGDAAKWREFTFSASDGWSIEYNDIETAPAGSDGQKYVYYVKEDSIHETGSGFTLSFVNNDGVNTGLITIVNTERGDVVNVEKSWQVADGSTDWPADVEVSVKLIKRRPNGQVIELTGDNIPSYYKTHTDETWNATQMLDSTHTSYMWENLDALLPGQTYEVVELSAGGNSVSDGKVTVGGKTYFVLGGTAIDGKAKLMNVEETGIHFEKTWRVPDSITFPRPDGAVVASAYLNASDEVTVLPSDLAVTVQLHRYVGDNDDTYDFTGSEIAAHTVTLSGSTWSADWNNLPAAFVNDEGSLVPYVYTAEEISVTVPTSIMSDAEGNPINIKDVFKATSTTSADGKTITMLNTMASDDDYYLSVTKTWRDGNNNVVTDEGPVKFKLLRDTDVTTIGGGEGYTVKIQVGGYGADGSIYSKELSNVSKIRLILVSSAEPTIKYGGESFDNNSVLISEVPTVTAIDKYYWNPNYGVDRNRYVYEINIYESTVFWVKMNANQDSNGYVNTETEEKVTFLSALAEEVLISHTDTYTGQVMKPDPDHAGKYIVDETGNYTFTLNPNQTINFKNLPYLVEEGSTTTTYKYTVVETTTGAFRTTVTYADGKTYYDPAPASGDKGVDGSVTITNKKTTVNEYGDVTLSLKKVKKGTTDPIENVLFTLTSGTTTVTSGSTNASGELTLTIPGSALGKHGGAGDTTTTKTFTLTETVPVGYQNPAENPWTVTVTANGATSTASGEVTTIHYNWQVTGVGSLTGSSGVYTIENEESTGGLQITKTVKVNNEAPTDANKALTNGTYTFTVYTSDGTTLATKADGTAIDSLTITVTNGVPSPTELTVNGLTPGRYVVKETASTNTNITLNSDKTVTVSAGATIAAEATAAFINNYETTTITLTKTWDDSADATNRPTQEQFLAKVHLMADSSDDVSSAYADAAYRSVTENNNVWTVTWANLPKNSDNAGTAIAYTVTEDSDLSSYYTAGTPTETDTGVWTVTNTRKVGNLTIKKALTLTDNGTKPAPAKVYEFTVSDGINYYYMSNGTLTTTTTEAEAHIQVTSDDDAGITLTGLPTGSYTVTEVGDTEITNYTLTGTTYRVDNNEASSAAPSVTVTDVGTVVVVATNTYEPNPGALTITKAIAPVGADASGTTFTFEVTFTNADDIAYVGYVTVQDAAQTTPTSATTDSNGKLTITITGTGTATISEIPAGTKYEVVETSIPEGWEQVGTAQITGGNANKVIELGETENATITNTKQISIYAKKVWRNLTAWPADVTSVTFQLQEKAKTEGAVWTNVADPEGEKTVSDLNAVNWDSLTPTKDYQVVETKITKNDRTVQTVSIVAYGSGTKADPFVVENTVDTISIPVEKSWTGTPPAGTTVEVELVKVVGESETSVATQTLPDNNNWSYTFTGLDKYNTDGTAITYKVKETKVTYLGQNYIGTNLTTAFGSTGKGSDPIVSTGTINTVTIQNTVETKSISAKKTWNSSNAAADWPTNMSVTFTLNASVGTIPTTSDGTYGANTPSVTINSQQTVEWTNLPKWTIVEGVATEINYSVSETAVKYNGTAISNYRTVYTVTGEGSGTEGLVTIDNTPSTTNLSVTKQWFQNNVQLTGNSFLPNATITVKVEKSEDGGTTWTTASDGTSDIENVELNRNDNWSAVWNGLPAYTVSGTAIQYRVTETAAKVNDTDDLDVSSQRAVVFDSNGSATLRNDLPTRDIVVEKAWSPTGWPSNIQSVTVGLYAMSGTETTPSAYPDAANQMKVVITANNSTEDAENVAKRTFSDLPVYDSNGNLITYSVQEISVTSANGSVISVTNGAVIVNGQTWTVSVEPVSDDGKVTVTNTKAGISINVTKKWTQGGNPKTTANSISFTLYQVLTPTSGGESLSPEVYTNYGVDGVGTVKCNNGVWDVETISNLPQTVTRDENGVTVTYTASYYVVETGVAADAGYVLTTTYSNVADAAHDQSASADPKDKAVSANGSTITIINTETAGVTLPSTGGPGTVAYTTAGLSLMSIALWMLLRRKKEQQN